ncbi:MAG: DUF72 domain-containing protein [Candidatus Methylarchaceae archaeon HK02M2]|nr:DUF72 domain-containing protein [Candidatus Methylarchaceae archaeon HK02M2]
MIWIGTSGYSFADWKGEFYPKSLKQKDFLRYYSRFFSVVEIDSTYYRIPHPKMFLALMKKVPREFKFTVKTPSTFTHEREKFEETLEPYKKSIDPLFRKGMLACILAQFPYSFKYSTENLDYVSEVTMSLEAPSCVEFRHISWQNEKVVNHLRDRGIGFVNVDLPKLPGLPRPSSTTTSDEIAYVRFHGRVDAKTWWHPPEPHERYNYEYSIDELKEWVPSIMKLKGEAKDLYIMFNNHYQGRAVRSAEAMTKLLPKEDLATIKVPQRTLF